MNCCTHTIDLGCFDSCDTIVLNEDTVGVDFIYPANGTYKFQFETQFRHSFSQEGVEGEIMELDLSMLPEDYEIELRIFNPDGSRFTVMYSSSESDCFRLTANIYANSVSTQSTTVADNCCKPKIIKMTGVLTKELVREDWIQFGAIPTIEVFYSEGSGYIPITVQPVFDQMPSPQTITITIPGIPTDDWFIKLS